MAMAGILMTPRTDSKIRKRFLANKFKNKSYNFKDILRERFKERIKANRKSIFQKVRSVNECRDSIQNTLCDYLNTEMDEFNESVFTTKSNSAHENISAEEFFLANEINIDEELRIMKEIENELLDEQMNWIMEEYHKKEEDIKFMMNDFLVCPICKRGILIKNCDTDPISCTVCNIMIFSSVNLENLRFIIQKNVDEHAKICTSNPQFAVIDELNYNSLFIVCNDCSLLNSLC